MSSFVLDTSALLACLNREPGSESVIGTIAGALLSTVNLAETMAVLVRQGASKEKAIEILGSSKWRISTVHWLKKQAL